MKTPGGKALELVRELKRLIAPSGVGWSVNAEAIYGLLTDALRERESGAAEAEREACAKEVERLRRENDDLRTDLGLERIAERIRRRVEAGQ